MSDTKRVKIMGDKITAQYQYFRIAKLSLKGFAS